MTVRRRRSDRSGRSKLHSPGRPDSARREELVRFWAAIATGRSSEDAARDAGVSPPVGSRWFRRSGGMPPSHLSQSAKPLSGRYLSFEEREEIALLRAQGIGIRHIACRLERAPSTISREVRRNAATREALRRYVQDRLADRISAPDGTDLSAHSPDVLAVVADALNTRPRKTLGWRTPAEALDQCLQASQTECVPTTG